MSVGRVHILPTQLHPSLPSHSFVDVTTVFNLDVGQLKLVYEALQERRSLLDNAPHLTSTLPILMPCYKWWEVPFYWAGLKAYDLIAGGCMHVCTCWLCVCLYMRYV